MANVGLFPVRRDRPKDLFACEERYVSNMANKFRHFALEAHCSRSPPDRAEIVSPEATNSVSAIVSRAAREGGREGRLRFAAAAENGTTKLLCSRTSDSDGVSPACYLAVI